MNFVQVVLMKQKFVGIVNRRKVFSNLKKIKKVLQVRFHEEVAVGCVEVEKNRYKLAQGLSTKK
jgi:predicted transcriptional regulator